MRAVIDQLKKELELAEALQRVTVTAFGPTFELPAKMPAINIVPRGKPRERQFIIGANPEYDAELQIELLCYTQALNLRDAFEKCETLAETVQTVLSNVDARDTLGVHYFSTQIETYEDAEFDAAFIYGAVILLTASVEENY